MDNIIVIVHEWGRTLLFILAAIHDVMSNKNDGRCRMRGIYYYYCTGMWAHRQLALLAAINDVIRHMSYPTLSSTLAIFPV